MKISKLAAVAVIAVGTVAAVRKFDLLNKGKALAEQGIEKATSGVEWLTAQADALAEKVLAAVDQAGDPTPVDDETPAPRGRADGETTYKTGDVL